MGITSKPLIKGAVTAADIGVNFAEGVLILDSHFDEIERIRRDPDLLPSERERQLSAVLTRMAASGAMTVFSAKADIGELSKLARNNGIELKKIQFDLGVMSDPAKKILVLDPDTTPPKNLDADTIVAGRPTVKGKLLDKDKTRGIHVSRVKAVVADIGDTAKAGNHVKGVEAKQRLHDLLKKRWKASEIERAEKLKKNSPKLDEILTDEEFIAIRCYTSEMYGEINPALRNQRIGEWEPVVDEASSGLTKLAENGLIYKGEVKRHASFSDSKIDELFKKDGVFTDKAFLSATYKKDGDSAFNDKKYGDDNNIEDRCGNRIDFRISR